MQSSSENDKKEAKDYAVSEEIKYNAQVQKNYPKISTLLRYIPSDVIHPSTIYKEFLLSAYKLLPKEEFAAMADALDGKGFDKESAKWNYIEEKSRIVTLGRDSSKKGTWPKTPVW